MRRQEKEKDLSEERQLSLRGNELNTSYIYGTQWLVFAKSVLGEQFSEEQIRDSVKAFIHSIPATWKDKKFAKQLKKASEIVRVDKRPVVAGNFRMSEETCLSLGIPAYEDVEEQNYFLMFQACVDLLQRRKLLGKVNPVEEIDFIELEKIGEAEAVNTRENNVQS